MAGASLAARLPTGREGRVLAAGLALFALVLAWFAVAAPLMDWYGARQQALDGRVAYAARMQAIAAGLPQARAQAAAAAEQAAPAGMILAGSSDPIAGAALESLIDGLTHDAGATLISTEAATPVQDGGFRRIGLHVTARAPWPKLVGLLAAIERAEPRMSIGTLQIQAGPLGGAEQLLDMSFVVSAYRAGTAAPAAPADAAASDAGPAQ